MGFAYLSNERKIWAFATAVLMLSSLSLSGCATSTAGSSAMDARDETPASPKTSIFDPPPKREKPAMTLEERLKLQKELMHARDRQAPGAKAKGAPRELNPSSPR
jgi:hypothetical protein